MIKDVKELSASVRYASVWADTLEGLRQHAEGTEAGLYSTTAAGPMAEVRRVLGEMQDFVDCLTEEAGSEVAEDYRLPSRAHQKVA